MQKRWWNLEPKTVFRAACCLVLLAGAAQGEIFSLGSRELHDGAGGDLAGVADAADFLARATAIGDFNGDGFDDIAAAEYENGLATHAGAVHVLYGQSAGHPSINPQLWTDFDPATLLGDVESGDGFGTGLAAGDFDGDGYDDLAIGVPNEDVGANNDAGVAVVIYGSELGLALDTPVAPRRFLLGSGGIGGVAAAGDGLGHALVAADFSGDGFDDLAIGIPSMSTGATSGGGVLVVYGSAGGLQTSNELLLSQDFSTMPETAENGDGFGAALAAGDFDADGNDDLAIGVPAESVAGSGCPSSGAVHVLYGDLGAGLILLDNQLWHALNVDTGDDCGFNDIWGATLAAGDLSADGAADLVIGAPFEDLPGVVDAGAITLLLGGVGTGLSTAASTLFDETDFAVAANPQTDDRFGYSLAIGDFRTDAIPGRLDLAIGIPKDRVWNGFESVATGSVLLTGGTLLQPSQAKLVAPGLAGYTGSFVAGQEFGWAIAAGDFNGDGHGDLTVGVPGDDTAAVAAGALWIAYGALFSDNFETNDLSRWSAAVP